MKICPPNVAAVFVDRANRIAESLQFGIALQRGEGVVPPISRKQVIAGNQV